MSESNNDAPMGNSNDERPTGNNNDNQQPRALPSADLKWGIRAPCPAPPFPTDDDRQPTASTFDFVTNDFNHDVAADNDPNDGYFCVHYDSDFDDYPTRVTTPSFNRRVTRKEVWIKDGSHKCTQFFFADGKSIDIWEKVGLPQCDPNYPHSSYAQEPNHFWHNAKDAINYSSNKNNK